MLVPEEPLDPRATKVILVHQACPDPRRRLETILRRAALTGGPSQALAVLSGPLRSLLRVSADVMSNMPRWGAL
jgi:hypothetical protein